MATSSDHRSPVQNWLELDRLAWRDHRHAASFDAYDQGNAYATTGAVEDMPPVCECCEAPVAAGDPRCERCEDHWQDDHR